MSRIIQDDTADVARIAIEQCVMREQSLTAILRLNAALRDLTPTSPDEHQISLAGGDEKPKHTPDPDYQSPGYGYWCTCGRRFHEQHLLTTHITANTVPSPRTEDWTLTELFGWYNGDPWCHECGATIDREQRDLHRTWHNKLLP